MSEDFPTYVAPERHKARLWLVDLANQTIELRDCLGPNVEDGPPNGQWFVPGAGTCTEGSHLFREYDDAVLMAKKRIRDAISDHEREINRLQKFIDKL